MHISTVRWTSGAGWAGDGAPSDAQLVLVFGEHEHFREERCFAELRERFPTAAIFGCSSAGSMTAVVTPVPAPGAIALVGLAGLAGSRRRRA